MTQGEVKESPAAVADAVANVAAETLAAPEVADTATGTPAPREVAEVATAVVDVEPVVSPALPLPASEPKPTPCMNCGAPLGGPYCSSCGQRHEPHVHSILEFAGEAFESLTHADSRLWRTLWLLFAKPGYLTKEFLDGRRVSYLPPFRLYLVMSVLLFLVIAIAGSDTEIVEAKISVTPSDAKVQVVDPPESETAEERADRICDEAQINIPGVSKDRARIACERALTDDGNPLVQSMLHNIPRALFLLLPLLALVMQLMYWRRRYVEHLLFFIHNHAFTFALYAVLIGLASFSSGWIVGICVLLMIFYPPLYTYRAMRRVFPQNRWLTRLKFAVLVFAYGNLMLIMALVTVSYSAATL